MWLLMECSPVGSVCLWRHFLFTINLMSGKESGPFPARPQVSFSLCVRLPSTFCEIYKIPIYQVKVWIGTLKFPFISKTLWF